MAYPADASGAKDYAGALDALVAAKPHVVLFDVANGIVDYLFAPLERRWPAHEPRPRYASTSNLADEHLRFMGSSAERRRRFLGLAMVSSTAENVRFASHYNETFSEATTLTDSPNNAYDTFYLLAYAAYASGADVTGSSLSRAFARLAHGPRIEVGLTGIFEAYSTLRRGNSFDLVGSSGSLDLDPATGESPVDLAVLCAGVDGRGRATHGIESQLVYRAATNALEGAMRCP